jgi:hypothetical protein
MAAQIHSALNCCLSESAGNTYMHSWSSTLPISAAYQNAYQSNLGCLLVLPMLPIEATHAANNESSS